MSDIVVGRGLRGVAMLISASGMLFATSAGAVSPVAVPGPDNHIIKAQALPCPNGSRRVTQRTGGMKGKPGGRCYLAGWVNERGLCYKYVSTCRPLGM